MKKKWIKAVFIGVLAAVFFSSVTVSAAPNIYQNLLSWAEVKSNEAKTQVEQNLFSKVEYELASLIKSTENNILIKENLFRDFGIFEKFRTSDSITSKANQYIKEMDHTSSRIIEETSQEFDQIVQNVNLQSNNILKSLETDYESELGSLSFMSRASNLNDNTPEITLAQEINMTRDMIKELEARYKVEQNQSIQVFIKKKIDMLNDLIFLLRED